MTYTVSPKGHERKFISIESYDLLCLCSRQSSWMSGLDLLSNIASNRKMDRSGVSGMSILGGIDTKFGYLALLDTKV